MLNFDQKCKKCKFCENVYEPYFDEPICNSCHLFIFPNIHNDFDSTNTNRLSNELKISSQFLNTSSNNKTPSSLQDITLKFARKLEKSDSNDSGNEDTDDLHHVNCTNELNRKNISDFNTNDTNVSCKIGGYKNLNNNEKNNLNPEKKSKNSYHEFNCIEKLPNEVLLKIFISLDDLSLWSVSQVCQRWYLLIKEEISDEKWRFFISERWVCCKPQVNIDSYQELYSQLVRSSNCHYCLQQIYNRPKVETCNEFKNSWRHKRLLLELKYLQQDPPDGINAKPLDSTYFYWQAITGPVGSPYEGGIFYLYLQIPQSYPLNPPLVRFITKIFHPNISKHGDIGLDIIHENWSLALTISKILISIQSLLTDPYTYICMERDIGELYRKNRDLFDRNARFFTWKYAMNDYIFFSNNFNVINNLNFYIKNE